MINGVKVSLVYHLYCKDAESIVVGTGNVYNEINRRCLEHFHDVFDDAVFCVCVDDRTDSNLIHKAVAWIWSCGFKDNVTIKVKPNSPYRDSQTFYDEVVDHLSDFDGMVFFGHNKGNTIEELDGLKQWIIFSYYSCLDEIENKIKRLTDHTIVFGYVPLAGGQPLFYIFNKHGWMIPGTFFLFNPQKKLGYLDKTGGVYRVSKTATLPRISSRK